MLPEAEVALAQEHAQLLACTPGTAGAPRSRVGRDDVQQPVAVEVGDGEAVGALPDVVEAREMQALEELPAPGGIGGGVSRRHSLQTRPARPSLFAHGLRRSRRMRRGREPRRSLLDEDAVPVRVRECQAVAVLHRRRPLPGQCVASLGQVRNPQREAAQAGASAEVGVIGALTIQRHELHPPLPTP